MSCADANKEDQSGSLIELFQLVVKFGRGDGAGELADRMWGRKVLQVGDKSCVSSVGQKEP